MAISNWISPGVNRARWAAFYGFMCGATWTEAFYLYGNDWLINFWFILLAGFGALYLTDRVNEESLWRTGLVDDHGENAAKATDNETPH